MTIWNLYGRMMDAGIFPLGATPAGEEAPVYPRRGMPPASTTAGEAYGHDARD